MLFYLIKASNRPQHLRNLRFYLSALILSSVASLYGCDNGPRGPYLQNASPSTITIKWRTKDDADSTVRYGTAENALNTVVYESIEQKDHELVLSGLNPNTIYYYQTESSDGSQSNIYSFKTSPIEGSQQPIRVWLIGDSGTADSKAESVRDAFYSFNGGAQTDLWLMLGDNAYTVGTDSEYQKAVFNMYPETLATTALWPTLGNHDAASAGGAPYYSIFTLPTAGEAGGVPSGTEAYYAFNYGNVHFVCLNSENVNRDVDGTMYNWLESDLQANTQDWTVVFFHHPPYSKGSHNSDSAGEYRMREMRENFIPLFDQYRVDMVFTGHSHSYERSFLVTGHTGTSDTLTNDMLIDNGNGREDQDGAYQKLYSQTNNGVVYTVAGSSGKTSSGSLDHPVHYVSYKELGSVVLDFNGHQVDAKFISPNANIEDHFTIIKL